MIILGIDPGLQHTGIALLKDGKLTFATTLLRKGPSNFNASVDLILTYLGHVAPTYAAVEDVLWYGRPRSGMLPLACFAGIITGYLLSHGVPVYLLPASFRTVKNAGVKKFHYPKALKDDHQKDAYQLALIAHRTETNGVTEAVKLRRVSPP